ncbi:YtfJ family protein [Flammeovirga aprica]|uniref:Thioredoxin domain-containing protein n=1 Tax=Flammeovirga aprica JL-4 TaxID=694437 RepID=A0A7X9RZG0_9BACT|nr:YtfJ family protein [Flammeovirga aprica]NME71525.1 hypothetical protein [Flammeovirga aprica JL-4]
MMKILLVFILAFISMNGFAQTATSEMTTLKRGDYIEPITVRDLKNNDHITPLIGEKVVMIFYADPDTPNANEDFVNKVKQWKFNLEEFKAYGIVNLKDSKYPNGIVRFMIRMIRKRSKREASALILTDPKGTVTKEWNTGDCNNSIGVLLVDNTGQVLFWKAGELTEEETDFVIQQICDHTTNYKKLTEEELKEFDL